MFAVNSGDAVRSGDAARWERTSRPKVSTHVEKTLFGPNSVNFGRTRKYCTNKCSGKQAGSNEAIPRFLGANLVFVNFLSREQASPFGQTPAMRSLCAVEMYWKSVSLTELYSPLSIKLAQWYCREMNFFASYEQ